MKRKYSTISLLFPLLILIVFACKEEEYALPEPNTGLQNDCIKRTLGPNLVGTTIEFAYAMALPVGSGSLVSARVEASIPGSAGTKLENRAFYTNTSGVDVGIQIGDASATSGNVTEVTFTRDTSAVTLRYYYVVPPEARGQAVDFRFSTSDSNGESVSYDMGPYQVARMDMALDLIVRDNTTFYFSIADMAVYDAATAAANPDKIDLVYMYRVIPNISFLHSLVSPAADPQYLPGVTLPAGVSRSTRMVKAWNLRDFHLARLQFGIYVDDLDFEQLDFSTAPNFAINLRAESGAWVETADGSYRAYIYVNSVANTATNRSMTLSIKRLAMNP